MSDTAGKTITCKAAVCWGAGEDLVIDITLRPGKGCVRVSEKRRILKDG